MSTSIQTVFENEEYPATDGTPVAETDVHLTLMAHLLTLLRYHFRARNDVYVAANMFLYYRKGHPEERRAPDLMVIKGVEDASFQRRSFKTWVEHAIPGCIIELTSKETAKEDLEEKKLLYQRLGVREYFLFDPLDEYLPHQFIGYHLVGDEYEELPRDDEGAILSAELGLRLRPEGKNLALYHRKTGERLQNLDELHESFDEMRVSLTGLQKELERKRNRIAELEAELARLQAPPAGPST